MQTTNTRRTLSCSTDGKGRRCVLVPLAHSNLRATVYADDLDRLAAQGITLNWQLNSNGQGTRYVKTALPGKDGRVVARIIAGARFKQQVRYRDGDTLNLRRDNLQVRDGGRAYKDCAHLLDANSDKAGIA